ERFRYVPVGVQYFFSQGLQSPGSDAVQLRTDHAPLVSDGMTGAAVLREYHFSLIKGNRGRIVFRNPCFHQRLPVIPTRCLTQQLVQQLLLGRTDVTV